MQEPKHVSKKLHAAHGTLLSYSVGFILSIILTMAAYLLVVHNVFEKGILIAAIVVLAIVQLVVQLVFFLHLANESKPRWNLVIFSFMLIVLGILVLGSLWIMQSLDYHMMPEDMDKHLLEEEGIH